MVPFYFVLNVADNTLVDSIYNTAECDLLSSGDHCCQT